MKTRATMMAQVLTVFCALIFFKFYPSELKLDLTKNVSRLTLNQDIEYNLASIENNDLSSSVGVRATYPGTNDKITRILIYKKNPFALYDEIAQSEINQNAFPLFYVNTSKLASQRLSSGHILRRGSGVT